MQTAPCDSLTERARPASLRSNFASTFVGNALYGASQWAVLSLIAKLGNSEMLGQYALAVAVTAPVGMLSHLNLRAVLVTDVEHRHPFGDYLAVRLGTTAASLIAISAFSVLSGWGWPVAAVILIIGVSLGAEHLSDIYYGPLQRRERMEVIARSMIARGLLSVAALGAALWLTRSLVWAVTVLALGRIAVLLAHDRPRGSAGERLSRSGLQVQFRIFRTALPLGVVLMLVSLTANLPRYAIERHLGTPELGAFAAVVSFVAAGGTVINALGQAATPRLARYASRRDWARFRRLVLGFTAVAFLLGVAGVLASALLGRVVLSVVYRPDYAAYGGVLVAAMAAGVSVYVAAALGYVLTSARAFAAQMPLLVAVAASSAVASWLLVPLMGLYGAALAVAIAAWVQIGGELLILRRAMRRREPAR